MTSYFNDPATMLEIVSNRFFITSIGKVLVQKGVISAADIASELSATIQALEKTGSGDKMLIAELKNILGTVATW